jgi:hypothetical protein
MRAAVRWGLVAWASLACWAGPGSAAAEGGAGSHDPGAHHHGTAGNPAHGRTIAPATPSVSVDGDAEVEVRTRPFDGSLSAPVYPGAGVVELGELPGPFGRPIRARLFIAEAPLEAVLAHYVEVLGAPARTVVGHVVRDGLAYVSWVEDADGKVRVLALVRSEARTYVLPSDLDPEAVLADAARPENEALPGEGAALSVAGPAAAEARSFVVSEPVERAAETVRQRFEARGFLAHAVQSVPGRTLLLLENDSGAAATVVVTAAPEGSRVTVQFAGSRVDRGAGNGAGSW